MRWIQPTPGLHVARDPRIPDDLETFPLQIESPTPVAPITWYVDGSRVGTTSRGRNTFPWRLSGGHHTARARIWLQHSTTPKETPQVSFYVH